MNNSPLQKKRKWVALGMGGLTVLLVYWFFFSNGLPVYWGPTASAKDIAAGRELFEHEWQPNDPLAHGDGLGPVFNAKSCAACHFQGGLGGGGEISHNATAFEVLPRPGKPDLECGTIHNYSVDPNDKENFAVLRKLFPASRLTTTRTVAMANCPPTQQTVTADFDPLRTVSVQSSAIFGSGWIDFISDKAIIQNFRRRSFTGVTEELGMKFDGVPIGRLRTLPDGRIGKFGWKAQFATLEDFVATACANEIGLGTPNKPQAKPITAKNKPDVKADLDEKQFDQLNAFVSTLPRPSEVKPAEAKTAAVAKQGKELFGTIGCATCHVPDLGGVKGVYTDLLLYALDPLPPPGGGGGGPYGPEPLPEFPRPEGEPEPNEWRTPPLWGVADSAPYMHDGSAMTLHDAIMRHDMDAKSVKQAYTNLSKPEQEAIVEFLETLKAPTNATPLKDESITKLPKKK